MFTSRGCSSKTDNFNSLKIGPIPFQYQCVTVEVFMGPKINPNHFLVEITSAFELPENDFLVTVQKMSDEITVIFNFTFTVKEFLFSL